MIKTKDMDKFIKFYAKLYSQNPNIPITSDTFYQGLKDYDYSKEERDNGDIRYMFAGLEEMFKNSNLNVCVSKNQTRFLQFNNIQEPKSVKMYVSFPKNYISQAAVKIFGYISNNNMCTSSKMADMIRSDSIVIRMQNKEDAQKVLDFINKDKELCKYARKTNPFGLKEGIVGMAYDDRLSYNSVISHILADYFTLVRDYGNFKKANLKEFNKYLNIIYNKTFVTQERLVDFCDTELFSYFRVYCNNNIGVELNNMEQVMRIIKNITSNNLTKDKLFDMYDDFTNDKQNIDYFSSAYCANLKNIQVNIVNQYIDYAIAKYGFDKVHLYLESYIDQNPNAITHDNSFYELFVKYIPFDDLEAIVSNNPSEYLANYAKNNADNSTYYLFISACLETTKKYGKNQAVTAVREGMNGNYKYFTNGEGRFRDKLAAINPAEIISILNKTIGDKTKTINYDVIIYNFIESLMGDRELVNNQQRQK